LVATLGSIAVGAVFLPAVAAAKSVKLKAKVIQVSSLYAGGTRCSKMTILVISTPPDIATYRAYVNQPGYMEFTFSGPPFTHPIVDSGLKYHVPPHHAAWFLGFGSGPAPCDNGVRNYRNPRAVGVLKSNTKH
jgi:hypothetical protein